MPPRFDNTVKQKVELFGVLIDNVSMEDAVSRISELVRIKEPSYVVTPNVDHVVRFQKSEEFRRIYGAASLVLADGMPIVWAAKLLGTPLKGRVSGSDLVIPLAEAAAAGGLSMFLLGGDEGTADIAARVLCQRYRNLKIAGTFCPPFGFERDESVLAEIKKTLTEARPDILLVGLGSPKQELWIAKYHEALRIPVCIGVGVTFSFLAGTVRRAPKLMQSIGLEWLWRLVQEPKRLWKRYIIDDLPFFLLVAKALLGRMTKQNEK